MNQKKYIYVQCFEREISEPVIFNNLSDAQAEMRNDFCNLIEKDRITEIKEEMGVDIQTAGTYCENEECELKEMYAWANDCGIGHINWDARIFEM